MNTNTVRFTTQVAQTMHGNGNYPIYSVRTPTSGLAIEVDLLTLQANVATAQGSFSEANQMIMSFSAMVASPKLKV